MPRPRDYREASALAYASDRLRTLTWLVAGVYAFLAVVSFFVEQSPYAPLLILMVGAVGVGLMALVVVGIRRGWTVAWIFATLSFLSATVELLALFANTGWWLLLLPAYFYGTGAARLLSPAVVRIFFRRPLRVPAVVDDEEPWRPPFVETAVETPPPAPKPVPSFDYFG